MNLYKFLTCFLYLVVASFNVSAQDIVFYFENDEANKPLTGGTLNITTAGSGVTNDWASNRFEGLTTSSFDITGITGVGSITGTISASSGNLNLTNSGLADGSSGFNSVGEGVSFSFSTDVTITMFDYSGFTSADSVELYIDDTSLGTYTDDTITASANFTNPNNVSLSLDLAAGEILNMTYLGGAYHLEEFAFTVPEPSFYSLLFGSFFATLVFTRRPRR